MLLLNPRPNFTMINYILNEFLINLKSKHDISEIPSEFSCDLLWKFVDGNGLQDDLLFFVSEEEEIQVSRHVPGERPSLEIKVDWTTSLVLNLIFQMNFRLRITSCFYQEGEIPGVCHLVINESTNKKVYSSPLEENLDNFYDSVESVGSHKKSAFSLPYIYFSVQDYETCFQNMKLGPEDILIVELYFNEDDETANNQVELKGSIYEKIDTKKVLFQGAISNKSLKEAYQRNTSDLGESKGSFIMMTGPDGIGEAQVHAIIDSRGDNENIDEIILSKIFKTAKKFKKLFFNSKTLEKSEEITVKPAAFNCRLTYVRLHWLMLLELLDRKQNYK